MPAVWRVSRLSLIPKSSAKRRVHQLRPLGLFPTLQKVAARAMLEGMPDRLLPHDVNGYMYRRNSGVSLALMRLRLAVERWREQGIPLCMLQLDLEDAFGTVRFSTAWKALKRRPGARHALPIFRLLLQVRTRVSWCGVDDPGSTSALVAAGGPARCLWSGRALSARVRWLWWIQYVAPELAYGCWAWLWDSATHSRDNGTVHRTVR